MQIQESRHEQLKVLLIIWKWKVFILSFFIIICICAIVFSGPEFIAPVFKSEVILYPPGTNSGKILIEDNVGFGTDKEIDEHIQILKSGILRDSILRKYHLMKHYKLDSTKGQSFNDLFKLFDEKVLIDRTRYNSISITVFDTDPVYAANIANDVAKIGDKVKAGILMANLKAAYHSMHMDTIAKGGANELMANHYVPTSYIITPAAVSQKKVSPTRWLIVVVAGFTSLFLSILMILFTEKSRELFFVLNSSAAANDQK